MKLFKTKEQKTIFWLIVVVIAMFAFAFALVPLYNTLCNVLGINGKTNSTAATNESAVDTSRTIEVLFTANRNEKLPWEFKPNTQKLTLHPGENKHLSYYAKNMSNHTMTIQAVPSVTPGLAAQYLKKTECFCFQQQTLKAGQAMDMPIVFHIDSAIPKSIREITLSYTLFSVNKKN